MKFISLPALLAALTCAAVVSCSSKEATVVEAASTAAPGATEIGAASLSLTVGDLTINTVTAVISRAQGGFQTQTHAIDVTGDGAVIAIFFGNLPVGRGYEVTLTAADCTGSSKFDVSAGVTTEVPVAITCPGADAGGGEIGSARVTGTIMPGGPPRCDHVSAITATPSIQNGKGPSTSVALVLDPGVVAANIVWTASSPNGGSGTIGNLEGNQDQDITFDCSASGLVQLVAAVTAPEAGKACTQQARVSIECINQVPVASCGDGSINQTREQCDGTALPASAPAGSTCSATCTLVLPNLPSCGDGSINGTEPCDPSAHPPVPATAPAGSTCSAACTLVLPNPPSCGDGSINGTEQCDPSASPPVPATAPAGSTCSATCTLVVVEPPRCGDGTINQPTEQCDGTALPATAPAGSTCSSSCTLVTGPSVGKCQHACVEDAETGACMLEFAAVAADSKPVLDCMLGATWPAPDAFPAGSCANGSLLSCYCGSLAAGACISVLPATLTGQCKNEILAGTACDTRPAGEQGACVAQRFTLDNAAGRAINYVACLQNNCPDVCPTAP